MSETILEKNLKTISLYNPELAKKIAKHENIIGNYHLNESKSGDSLLYKDDVSLDDPVDPVWTALEKVNNLEHKTKNTITIIVGLGLGYIFKETSKRYKGKILLHEPNLDILRIVLEIVDFSEELDNVSIFITNTYEDIENAFHSLYSYECPVNTVHSYYYLNNEGAYLKEFKNKVSDILGIFHSNYKNLFTKTRRWTYGVFGNIPHILKNQDLHVLSNKFKNKTVVIISAGPSLDKNIQDLKPYRDKLIIFCVGTALKTALKNGIIPDFTMVLEMSKNTKVQLEVPELSDINVIISNTTYSEVFKLNPKRFFNYYGNKTPASKWLGIVLDAQIEKYEEAGTVSLSSFYAAKILGCDKIIFIGQDLAYTDNKCYSKDSVYGNYKLDDSKTVATENMEEVKNILKIDETTVNKHLDMLSKELIEVKGQNGKMVVTRPDMLLFIKYFEKIAQNLGNEITLVNATEGGAYLEGLEHITLKEALSKYTNEEVIDVEKIIKNYEIKQKEIQKRKKIVENELNRIIKNYYQAYNIVKNSVENNIFPYFGSEVKEILDFEVLSKYIPEPSRKYKSKLKKEDLYIYINSENKIIKGISNTELNQEERLARWAAYAVIPSWKENLEKNIETLFNENPEDFNKNLKLVKEDFYKINDILEGNAFLKNLYFEYIYNFRNKIKNSETEEELISLSKELNHFLIYNAYLFWPENIKTVSEIIKKL